MSNLTRYNQSTTDRHAAAPDESLFGHLVEEQGWTVKEALENLAPIAKQTYSQTVSVASSSKWLAAAGGVIGLIGGGTLGLVGALPIGAAALAFFAYKEANQCIPRREIELRALKQCPTMLDLMFGCHLKGIEAKNLIAAWDIFLDSYADAGSADANLMAREYLRILDGLCFTVENDPRTQNQPIEQPAKAIAPVESRTNAPQENQSFTLPIATAESKLFDWSLLNSAYDDFPHLLILGKTGSGKTYLAEKLGRFLNGSTLVITPKRKPKDFQGMQVIGLPYDFPTIAANIAGLSELVKQREAQMNTTGDDNFLPINVILDEVPTFVAGCKDLGLDVVKDLKFIIRAGRTSKVRLILLAQGQEVKTLGIEGEGSLRDNLSYVYLKGFAEAQAKELKLDISKYDRPCLIDGKVADISQLVSLASEATPVEIVEHKPTATAQDLERLYNAPSAEHEVEESAIEIASSQGELKAAFPSWKAKSLEVAALVIDWLKKKSDESYRPSDIRSNIHRLKNDPSIPSDRLKSLLDLLVTQGFLQESEGKYSAAIAQPDTDDYDF
ncbi:type IV secretory system conjugative DNA transfer family protein [Leptolyngbya sp. DQ-M1]|uniref:type IV secretory system conjugative DNA transfer family protein n=1 Tax=Leptolyngbya sp. DQ-M1 TaxID=2933920 RepID=UPI0032996E1B